MIKQHKNRAAINELIRQLRKHSSWEIEEVRQQCTRVVYTCFLMGIEPFQLPITKNFAGDLSEEQKGDFLQRYLVLLLDNADLESTATRLSCRKSVSSLVQVIDEILERREPAPAHPRQEVTPLL
ncbi:hypothetical protein JWJ90_10335 [Desulfobulbus rhabdoformis]|uniref:hypothetical protein n=1 Tax=Desulfobulbus rhabdoformis TaxID=34032 RepID=UPI001963C5D7|nr:hypothetical protein [Desulfobulbus rhabdoformis]MBM9614684.1 hypothetical protein [Desulfobulbus rhabdoformis]